MINYLSNRTKDAGSLIFTLLTSKLRMSPSFMIIGEAKCGTTSLYHYLCQHPQIISASNKEIHFFDRRPKQFFRYSKYFPLRSFFSNQGLITGEASPSYLYFPNCAEKISEKFPDMKIIIILRNPSCRAYSHFLFSRDMLKVIPKNLTFKELVELCLSQIESELINYSKYYNGEIEDNEVERRLRWLSILDRGFYLKQIKKWREKFPSKNFLILSYESFFFDINRGLENVFKFLDLDTSFQITNTDPLNVNNERNFSSKEFIEMKPFLDNLYEKSNAELAEYLKEEFNIELSWS